MGLIMLILIGVAPTAYALNRAMPDSTTPAFLAAITSARTVLQAHAGNASAPDGPAPDGPRTQRRPGHRRRSPHHRRRSPENQGRSTRLQVFAAMVALAHRRHRPSRSNGTAPSNPSPPPSSSNVRNDMYLASDAVRVMKAGRVHLRTR